MRAGSLRLGSVPLELRVREVQWYLGRNSAGHLNPRTNVQQFMRQEARAIIEHAMETADPSQPREPIRVGRRSRQEGGRGNRARRSSLGGGGGGAAAPAAAAAEAPGAAETEAPGPATLGGGAAPGDAEAEAPGAAPAAADAPPEVRPSVRENSFVR